MTYSIASLELGLGRVAPSRCFAPEGDLSRLSRRPLTGPEIRGEQPESQARGTIQIPFA